MRPQYANAFSVMKNGTGTEVIITFSQQYAEQKNDNKVEQKIDELSSIVITPELALNLVGLINKIVGVEYPPAK